MLLVLGEIFESVKSECCVTVGSREKQKMLKDHSLSPRSSTSSAVSESDSAVKSAEELKLCEAEQRLKKHRWDCNTRADPGPGM